MPEVAGSLFEDVRLPDGRIEWNVAEVHRFVADPEGPLGRTLMHAIGEIVLAGAKRRALRRTGHMIEAMTFEVLADEGGLYTAITSPVQNPKTGFPYALVHEDRHPRDRRPHRSLVPALGDVRKIDGTGR